MAMIPDMPLELVDYSQAYLEALEAERPELGRLELIDGALHATGGSAVGNLHQLLLQRLHLLFAAACPPTSIVRIDTWWRSPRGKLRPDVAVYAPSDVPEDRQGMFAVPPRAIVEILSADAEHDLVRKDEIYAEHGVRRAYLEPFGRFDWWLRLDGVDHDGAVVHWQLDGWPALRFDRDELLAD